jgi:hypothetical protein
LCEENTEFLNDKLGAIINVVLYKVKSFTAIAKENGGHFLKSVTAIREMY